jgi:DNA-3-methyladenine glycosylase
VAQALLGKYLVRETDQARHVGRIYEVEAYIGQEDRACHASKGRTPRTDVMFGPPGVAYVYLIYGMYHCLNIVTEAEGFPAAILVRAVDEAGVPPVLIDGPGRLCRAFQIDRSHNRLDMTVGQGLWVEDRGVGIRACDIASYPRIGVPYAGDWAQKPWRFRLTTSQGDR